MRPECFCQDDLSNSCLHVVACILLCRSSLRRSGTKVSAIIPDNTMSPPLLITALLQTPLFVEPCHLIQTDKYPRNSISPGKGCCNSCTVKIRYLQILGPLWCKGALGDGGTALPPKDVWQHPARNTHCRLLGKYVPKKMLREKLSTLGRAGTLAIHCSLLTALWRRHHRCVAFFYLLGFGFDLLL
jgi:hypothetical protein